VNLILLGPPAAGKGTQAKFIAKKFNLYQLSTGDLLRDEIKNKTEIGKKIEHIIAHGDLVVDEIVNQLLKTVIKNSSNRNNIIFDGYPRNINQAKNLEIILNEDNQSLNYIFFLKVTREIIEKRILGRITCNKCNTTFNQYLDMNEINKHECGTSYLKKREDDNEEVIITRYDEYMLKTKPVLDFYSSRNYFHEIDGTQKIQAITGQIEQILTV
jgi:adenylate kinase